MQTDKLVLKMGRHSEVRAEQSAEPGYNLTAWLLAQRAQDFPHTLDLEAAWSDIAHVFRWLTVNRGLGCSVTCIEPASLFVFQSLCPFTTRLKLRGSRETPPHSTLKGLIRLRGTRAPVGREAGCGSHGNSLVVFL